MARGDAFVVAPSAGALRWRAHRILCSLASDMRKVLCAHACAVPSESPTERTSGHSRAEAHRRSPPCRPAHHSPFASHELERAPDARPAKRCALGAARALQAMWTPICQ